MQNVVVWKMSVFSTVFLHKCARIDYKLTQIELFLTPLINRRRRTWLLEILPIDKQFYLWTTIFYLWFCLVARITWLIVRCSWRVKRIVQKHKGTKSQRHKGQDTDDRERWNCLFFWWAWKCIDNLIDFSWRESCSFGINEDGEVCGFWLSWGLNPGYIPYKLSWLEG